MIQQAKIRFRAPTHFVGQDVGGELHKSYLLFHVIITTMNSQSLTNMWAAFLKRKAGRFILVGVVGAIVELGLFSGLIKVGLGFLFSNFIAFHCAFALCFYLHYHYTHQRPYAGIRMVVGGFAKYAGLMYAQFIVGSLLLWFLIDKLDWMPELAKIVQIGTVTPVSYVVQKLIIFRGREAV